MKLGIDIRALQTGHKFRGIGEACKQTTNHLLSTLADDKDVKVIFFEYDDPGNDPKKLLTIPKGLAYTVRTVGPPPESELGNKKAKLRRAIRDLILDPIPEARGCDVYLQYDYAMGVPSCVKRSLLMSYDFIPSIFKNQYFISMWEPFRARALRSTVRTIYHNYRFNRIMKRSYKNARKVIAVSENTKNDALRFTRAKAKNISVVYFGIDETINKTNGTNNKVEMPTKPYLLFVGAGDQRRRVDDLVAAFNNLRAAGNDIQLALVGENFIKQETIPLLFVRDAVLNSSYKEDILMMGYVDDNTKQELYKNAIAYVYPTLYEGFGIPVLESMLLGCPIITYKNSSLPEIGGEYAHYAKDWWDLKILTEKILKQDARVRSKQLHGAKLHAQEFTWIRSAGSLYRIIDSVVEKRSKVL